MTLLKEWDGAAWRPRGFVKQPRLAGVTPQKGEMAVDLATSSAINITGPGSLSPNVWSGYIELVAAMPEAAQAITVFNPSGMYSASGDSSQFIQIALGDAGNEETWATVLYGYQVAYQLLVIPGHIPAGSRVSFRILSARGSIPDDYMWDWIPAAHGTVGTPHTYGIPDFSIPRGTVLAVPSSMNTKGAWTEIVASTLADAQQLCFQVQGGGSTNLSTSGAILDIAVGPSGFEVPVVRNAYFLSSSSEYFYCFTLRTLAVDIPAGSRIAARYQRGAASTTTMDLALTLA